MSNNSSINNFETVIHLIEELKSDSEIPVHMRNNLKCTQRDIDQIFKNFKDFQSMRKMEDKL